LDEMSKGFLCIENEIFILPGIEEFVFDGPPEAFFEGRITFSAGSSLNNVRLCPSLAPAAAGCAFWRVHRNSSEEPKLYDRVLP